MACVAVAVAVLALYLLTFTKCYNEDALYHAQMVEGLRPHSPYFRPGHLLLIPLLQAWHWLLQHLGFSGRAILSAQYLNAMAGAIGVGFLAASLQAVTRAKWLAAPLAILAGGGFGLWWVSVDAHGYSIPFLCLSVVLWLLVRREQEGRPTGPVWHGLAVGVWHSAAVLVHQMAVFAGPGILLFLLLGRKPGGWRIRAALTYLTASSLLVGGSYLLIAFGCGYARSAPEFLAWNAGTKGAGPFGTPFHPGYVVPKFARGFAQMFVWYNDNSSVVGKKFLEGKLGLVDAIRQCSLMPLLIFWTVTLAAIGWLAVSWRSVRTRLGHWPVALGIWGLSFFLFFAWWLCADPWKWCFALGPFLVLVAVSVDEFVLRTTQRIWVKRATLAVLWALAIGCVVNNWAVKMWPESRESHSLQASHRLGEVMTPKDLLLSPYASISDYVEYFERKRILDIYMFAKSCWHGDDSLEANRARVLTAVDRQIRGIQSDGGRVFLETRGLFAAEDSDWAFVHPWTLYRSDLKWKGAMMDLQDHLRQYHPKQAFPEFPEIWILEKRAGDNEHGS